jgi:hypothetical protein
MRKKDKAGRLAASDVIDITSDVCCRMAPFEIRAELSAANGLSEELQDEILGRFYSSLREQAFFCAAGTQQRGLVLFEQERIVYVPEHRVESTLPVAQGRAKQLIRRAVRSYDPWLEAIILLLCGSWCSVWRAHEHSAVKWLAYSRLGGTAGLL